MCFLGARIYEFNKWAHAEVYCKTGRFICQPERSGEKKQSAVSAAVTAGVSDSAKHELIW